MANVTAWLAAMATIQAIAALLLVWMARSTARSAQHQAQAASTQATVAHTGFLINFAGQQIAAAEALRGEAYDKGLDKEALEIERTITAWFDLSIDADEGELQPILRRLLAANLTTFKAIRDAEHSERNRIGGGGGALP